MNHQASKHLYLRIRSRRGMVEVGTG